MGGRHGQAEGQAEQTWRSCLQAVTDTYLIGTRGVLLSNLVGASSLTSFVWSHIFALADFPPEHLLT